MNKIFIVAKREYLRIIRKPAFWFTIFFFPAYLIFVGFISGTAGEDVERKIAKQAEEAQAIYIVDEAGVIDENLLQGNTFFAENLDEKIEEVKQNNADAVIYYPKNILQDFKITLHQKDIGLLGILGGGGFSDMAKKLLRSSILLEINDPTKITAYNASYEIETTAYENGVATSGQLERLILPGVAVLIYFVMVMTSVNYLLASVAEEKENRMIETVLSILKPRELISGKIFGLLAVSATGLTVLIATALVAINYMNIDLPINLAELPITPLQLIAAIFYLFAGILILSGIMVGAGAAMPSYKEAQSLSSVFIVMSMLPFIFFTVIIVEPSGTAGMIGSYFPFTSAMLLMFRNALGELSLLETVFSSVVLLTYVIISFWLAFKLFEFGSLQYNRRISLRSFLRSLRNK